MVPDLTAIAALSTSLKTAAEMAKAAVDLRDDEKMRGTVINLQREISAALTNALSAQMDVMGLIEKVRGLEAELSSFKAWETKKERYSLHAWPTGDFSYRLKQGLEPAEPEHHVCADCFAKGNAFILNRDDDVFHDRLKCHSCGLIIRMAPNGVADRLDEEVRRRNAAYDANPLY